MSRMRRYWLTALLVFLTSQTSFAEPRLHIAGNRFEFGTTPQGSTVVQYFWFKSVGTDTVKITEVKTGCSCTSMPLEKTSLAPGDSMQVGVVWEIGKNITGSDGKYPRIYVEGQTEPERIFLTADATIFPDSSRPISIKPFRAELTRMSGRSIDEMKVTLTNHSTLPVALKMVSPEMQEFVVNIPDSLQPNETAVVLVGVAAEFKDKEFSRSVTLAYDGGAVGVVGRITIPIRRKIIS
ncbi:MAG: DUF1573 domain-containing protein [bacterium]|nr:DUF1573 domain-containing protein [bacterium]